MISIFTTYTNPEQRNDPYLEALECYEEFADEVIITGKDWPYEFSWEKIGETFQDGFNKVNGDWAIRMDIDYFFHEKDFKKIKKKLNKYKEYPAVSFPQYQFFTPRKYHLKTRLCIALNKKKFPDIKLNGGGDLCLATLNNKLISPSDVPSLNIPIYQYDSMFRTKNIISEDRARFARAWFRYFNDYGSRGGATPKEAFEAWLVDIEKKLPFHTNKMNFNNHPKYIKKRIESLTSSQFGFNCFGLEAESKFNTINYLKGKKEIYIGSMQINKKLN